MKNMFKKLFVTFAALLFSVSVFARMVHVDQWIDGGPCGMVHVSGWVDYGTRQYNLHVHGSEPCFESGNYSGNFMVVPDDGGGNGGGSVQQVESFEELAANSVSYSGNLTKPSMVNAFNAVVAIETIPE